MSARNIIVLLMVSILLSGLVGCEQPMKNPAKVQAKLISTQKTASSAIATGSEVETGAVTAKDNRTTAQQSAAKQQSESKEASSAGSNSPSSGTDKEDIPDEDVDEDTIGSAAQVPVAGTTQVTATFAAHTSSCQTAQQEFITDTTVRQETNIAIPAAREPYTDPVFRTCIIRVTDTKEDKSSDDDSAGMKDEYSRVQSFNADNTKLMIRGIAGTWYVYDAKTLKPIKQIDIGTDPRWDADDPDLLYYSDGTGLYSYDISEEASTLLHDFAGDFPGKDLVAVWTRYEGSPSFDSRYWGLMAQDQDWKLAGFVVYDAKEGKVIGKREIAGEYGADSVTISPLGNYFLAYFDNYCERGSLGTDASPCGLMVYDQDLKNGRGLLRIIGHSDTAVDADGNEVMIYQDIDTDNIAMLDLNTGKVTGLFQIDFSQVSTGLHFSGRASKVPGWAIVSTYNGGDPTDYTWMDDQVFAVELKENGKVLRLAHHHSLYNEEEEHDYWAEPHATVNQDFTRILFTSNWGKSGTEEVETYMIELPQGWTGKV